MIKPASNRIAHQLVSLDALSLPRGYISSLNIEYKRRPGEIAFWINTQILATKVEYTRFGDVIGGTRGLYLSLGPRLAPRSSD